MGTPRDTRSRLIAAASKLFAERGFHGTTVREIAERAGANVAAGNYHYGSKKALYLEVFRAQFTQTRAALAERGTVRPPAELDRLGHAALARLLRSRVRVMLDLLLGPPPGLHGTLMQREMCDPSEALPVIATEFVQPMIDEMRQIVMRLEPDLDRQAVDRCVLSIAGQALFYRFTMPVMLQLRGQGAYGKGFTREMAEHITAFSLGGMRAVAGSRRRAR